MIDQPFVYEPADVHAARENLFKWLSTSIHPSDLGMLASYAVVIGLSVDLEGKKLASIRPRQMSERLLDEHLSEQRMHWWRI